jgi:hypothetical protein
VKPDWVHGEELETTCIEGECERVNDERGSLLPIAAAPSGEKMPGEEGNQLDSCEPRADGSGHHRLDRLGALAGRRVTPAADSGRQAKP